MARSVAIHQPNFFPWLGYFDKIRRADRFVFLDRVQQQKTGGTWTNRVKLLIGGEGRWATAPIDRSYHGARSIAEIGFMEGSPWRDKLLRTLEAAYARAPHYAGTMEVLAPLVADPETRLAEYNIRAVSAIAAALGMDTGRLCRSSQLEVEGRATDLLVAVVQAVGGTSYLCGGGAGGYQDDAAFAAAGLALDYQSFVHPVYPQLGAAPFVPGLSIVDALMSCGFAGVAALLAGSPKGQ
jgi:hypothetical protein